MGLIRVCVIWLSVTTLQTGHIDNVSERHGSTQCAMNHTRSTVLMASLNTLHTIYRSYYKTLVFVN